MYFMPATKSFTSLMIITEDSEKSCRSKCCGSFFLFLLKYQISP